IEPGSTVVCLVSGGNNDISRYPEILERSLVHEGLKHYFIVDFPQEPGALRRFLNEGLGPEDDIAMFEYVKRSDRETGPAFVGIRLGYAADLPNLLERMEASSIEVERVHQNSPMFRLFAYPRGGAVFAQAGAGRSSRSRAAGQSCCDRAPGTADTRPGPNSGRNRML